jgi:UTP--glucose-1-phosphate uridylyltransferase
MKAVIMAAGYGTRFLPFSKAVSKTMLPIIDKPTIQLIVEEALESGVEEVLIIVGSNKESIIKHFSNDEEMLKRLEKNKDFYDIAKKTCLPQIKFVEQKVLNGTGSAIMLAKDFVGDEPFLLMFADDLMVGNKKHVSRQMIELFEKTGKTILGCQHVSKEAITKYSSVEYSKQEGRVYTVTKITEKPKLEDVKSTLSTLGRYILKSNIFEACQNLKEGIGGEKIITDAYDVLARQGDVLAYDFDGIRYDIGNKFGYLTAIFDYAMNNPEYSEKLKAYIKERI